MQQATRGSGGLGRGTLAACMHWQGSLFQESLLRITNLKRCAGWIGVAFTAAAGLVAIFVFLGGYNVAATSHHWAATIWLLRTVRDASIAVRQPDEIRYDGAPLRLAAGHYADACAACHSAPRRPV